MDMNQLTRIFCDIDDFCKEFDGYMQSKLLPAPSFYLLSFVQEDAQVCILLIPLACRCVT